MNGQAVIRWKNDRQLVPLESVERVIDDFRTRIEKLERVKGVPIVDGAILGYSEVVNELRKVVDDYGKGKE